MVAIDIYQADDYGCDQMAPSSAETGGRLGRIMGDLFHVRDPICAGKFSAWRGVLREQSCCPTRVRFSAFETTRRRRLGRELQGQPVHSPLRLDRWLTGPGL